MTKDVLHFQEAPNKVRSSSAEKRTERRIETVSGEKRERARAEMKAWLNEPATKDVLKRLSD